jgi:hypothetical protein
MRIFELRIVGKPLSSGLNVKPSRKQAETPALKMWTMCSLEMTVDFQRTARRYIPEDRKLYIYLLFSQLHIISKFNLQKTEIIRYLFSKYGK